MSDAIQVSRILGASYFVVDMAIVDITGCWESAALFTYLRKLYAKNNYQPFSYPENKLMSHMRLSKRGIKGAKKILLDKGLISVELKGAPAKHYFSIDEERFIQLLSSCHETVQLDVQLSQNDTYSCTETVQLSNTLTRQEHIKPPKVPQGDGSFEIFLKAWPGEGTGTDAARKKWEKLKPDLDTVLKAIDSLKSYKEKQLELGLFCPGYPNPATWLNQRRWEDQNDISKLKAPKKHKPTNLDNKVFL